MSQTKILFVVEGKKAEPTFLKHLWKRFQPEQEFEIYSYNTNLSALSDEYYRDGDFDEDLDLIKLLKEKGTDSKNRHVLDLKFNDIFLVFDMDPQATSFDETRLKQMMYHFNDSTGCGKLYLSYPMLEAWKDIKSEDDPEFENRCVKLDEIRLYKSLVHEKTRCWEKLNSMHEIEMRTFRTIIEHHLKKARKILFGHYSLPSREEFLNMDLSEILDKQLDKWIHEKSVFVLSTPLFCVVEYNTLKFFGERA